jgi:hypothetical protein
MIIYASSRWQANLLSPSPVMQLYRLPPSSNSRSGKKRADMSNTFDELSSHLHTTFSALSYALARNKTRHPSLSGDEPSEPTTVQLLSSAYLAFLVGPTPGAPKARIMLALEGIQVGKSDMREDSEEEGKEEDEDEDEEEDVSDVESEGESEGGAGEGKDCDPSTGIRLTVHASPPPASQSPSAPSFSSSAPPCIRASTSEPSHSAPLRRLSLAPKTLPLNSSTQPHSGPATRRNYAQEQGSLRSAERLLSRTLAAAAAETGGMASELGACTLALTPVPLLTDSGSQPPHTRTSCSAPRGVFCTRPGSRART